LRNRPIWQQKYDIGEAHTRSLDAHHSVVANPLVMLGRQLAWSRDGKWCVAVGSWGTMVVLGRWEGRAAGS